MQRWVSELTSLLRLGIVGKKIVEYIFVSSYVSVCRSKLLKRVRVVCLDWFRGSFSGCNVYGDRVSVLGRITSLIAVAIFY
uniref:PH domain-containing protein n=1 Tax=Ascaris lumbricoides TaxID=6252 RepID=A0A0M3HT61_ASCLU